MKLNNYFKFPLLIAILTMTGCYPVSNPSKNSESAPPPSIEGISWTGKIAFISDMDGKFAIYTINVDGSNLENLTKNLAFSSAPAWSPDGRHIAFSAFQEGPNQIYIMDNDGANQKQLTDDPTGALSPVWSPSGKNILFLSNRDNVQSSGRGVPLSEIYIMNSDGSKQQRLTNNQDLNEGSLSWSPKGDMIAASIGNPSISRYAIDIYLLDLSGVIHKQLTKSGVNTNPSWSPDGEFIVFSSFEKKEECSGINIINVQTTKQVCVVIDKMSPQIQNLTPSWSPDGEYIIFSSNLDGDYDIYIIKIDGSGLTQLTNLPGDETSPVWSAKP